MSAGLKVHKFTRSKTVPGTESTVEIPLVSFESFTGFILKLKCLNESGKTGKPKGIVFVRVRWIISDNPDSNPNRWIDFTDNTKGVIELKFQSGDAGKKLSIAVCYVTNKGKEGTYCAIITTKVPVV